MKTINVTFEDRDFESLNQVRAGKPWRDFILSLVPKDVSDPETPKSPGKSLSTTLKKELSREK
jgi:hypothetical protein